MKAGTERRRHKRRPILESFSLFVVIPKKGGHRLPVYDVSDEGILFDLDTEGEPANEFPMQAGESIELQFYINQTFFLPLKLKVVRVQQEKSVRRVGAEIQSKGTGGYKAYQGFLQMIDATLE